MMVDLSVESVCGHQIQDISNELDRTDGIASDLYDCAVSISRSIDIQERCVQKNSLARELYGEFKWTLLFNIGYLMSNVIDVIIYIEDFIKMKINSFYTGIHFTATRVII